MKLVYLFLCIAGTVLPYWPFAPWVMVHGLDLRLLLDQLFANRISAFFGMDVLVSAVVMAVFIRQERRRLGPVGWLPLAALLTVGVSLALPMLLYLREAKQETCPNASS